MQRQIYLSGKVMMDDGTPPPERVVVERVCNGMPRPEGYTDSKGRFSIQLGQNNAMIADASTDMGNAGAFGGPMNRGVSTQELTGCELRASLAGFRSDSVQLVGRRSLDNPDVGTIILHRLAKVEGYTFSATSALAPKSARKAYEKAVDKSKKEKWEEAEKLLNKAVEEYPKYAAAWYELGVIYQRQNKMDDAKRAYEQSIGADSKYVNPYGMLALIAAYSKNWEDVKKYTGQSIRLNPFFSPQIYFFAAVANFNTGNHKEAEEQALEAAKMDEGHRLPKVNQLLAMILEEKGDLKGAAEQMRIYLKAAPNANDAMTAQQHLTELEKRAGGVQP